MSTIDIRTQGTPLDKVIYSKDHYVLIDRNNNVSIVDGSIGEDFLVMRDDLENLIKALQRAQSQIVANEKDK